MTKAAQIEQITTGKGFIAALDQSGGSTPGALERYGIDATAFSSEAEMFDLMHAMRARIATAPDFTGDKVIGAILFEKTMDSEIDGMPSAQFMWEKRRVVPFLKVDQGLEEVENGVQLLRPITGLDELLDRANDNQMFGTKMRSVIHSANKAGIDAIVSQQFEVGAQIQGQSLVPILEPEVNITASDKAEIEEILLESILHALDNSNELPVMLKLTLPEKANLYRPLIEHPKVLRVVALSGGYSAQEATARLKQNDGIIASFSRGLTEGLSIKQDDAAFNALLGQRIAEVAAASA